MKIPKSGLFIDKAPPDREAPPVEVLPVEEGAIPVVVSEDGAVTVTVTEVVPVVPEMIPGEWFWTLIARNGNVIAGNGGFNTSQSALKSIRATRNFFAKNKLLKVYNVVTGEMKGK